MKFKETRACSNCVKGTAIAVNNDILCWEKGAVSPDYTCSKHRFIPNNKKGNDVGLKCIQCEHFIGEFDMATGLPALGICKLFSVRQYDGYQKKACSKFLKRTQLEVS